MPHGRAPILNFIANTLKEDLSPAQAALLSVIYGYKPPLEQPQDSDSVWQRNSLNKLYNLPIEESADCFQACTGRMKPPYKRQDDITVVCGRRSGKTGRVGVNIGLFECVHGKHEKYLSRGERAHVVLMAQSMRAVNEAMLLVKGKITHSPELHAMVDEIRATEVTFATGMVLSIWPCTFYSIRGLHIPVCIMDEVGAWDVEGVDPDVEVVNSVRPAMATFPARMLVKLSTPWTRAGILWHDYKGWWAKEGGPLVWQAPTWYMNPAVPTDFLTGEYAKDPEYARREFGALFTDLQAAFLPAEAIEAAVDHEVYERRPERSRAYYVSLDVAFKTDSTILAVGHLKDDVVILDIWRAWKPEPGLPVNLDEVAYEVAVTCRRFGCRTVMGDQYASEPVRQALQGYGITFLEVVLSAKRIRRETVDSRHEIGASKQDIYGAMKTLLLQNRLRLLDNPAGLNELRLLEVKRSWSGYEQVGAPSSAHDDFAFALALVCWQAWESEELRDRAPTATKVGPTLLDWQMDEIPSALPGAMKDIERINKTYPNGCTCPRDEESFRLAGGPACAYCNEMNAISTAQAALSDPIGRVSSPLGTPLGWYGLR